MYKKDENSNKEKKNILNKINKKYYRFGKENDIEEEILLIIKIMI
jgi:hypothetical protein